MIKLFMTPFLIIFVLGILGFKSRDFKKLNGFQSLILFLIVGGFVYGVLSLFIKE